MSNLTKILFGDVIDLSIFQELYDMYNANIFISHTISNNENNTVELICDFDRQSGAPDNIGIFTNKLKFLENAVDISGIVYITIEIKKTLSFETIHEYKQNIESCSKYIDDILFCFGRLNNFKVENVIDCDKVTVVFYNDNITISNTQKDEAIKYLKQELDLNKPETKYTELEKILNERYILEDYIAILVVFRLIKNAILSIRNKLKGLDVNSFGFFIILNSLVLTFLVGFLIYRFCSDISIN